MAEPVYLVDGSGYIFRAFYAVAPLTTKSGFPTNALFGFTKMLKKLLAEAKSDNVAVIFDSGRETFRKEIYADYKANRTAPPEDLQKQFPYFTKIAEALGLAVFVLPGYEADDIIGTLAQRISDSGDEVVIVSGDKDFMQLVGSGVSIWDTMNDRHIGKDQVKEKFGVFPEQVVDILALIGDSSDNIPGLSGVGPKTAVQLIEKFGDIETILASATAILEDATIRNRKTLAQKIELEADTVRLSQKLARIVTDAPIELGRDGSLHMVSDLDHEGLLRLLKRAAPKQNEIGELVSKLQFDSLLSDIPSVKKEPTAEEVAAQAREKYSSVLAAEFSDFLKKLKHQKNFSFDLETTALDPFEAKIVGASFCWDDESAYYLPIGHVASEPGLLALQTEIPGQINLTIFLNELRGIFEDPKIHKSGQNLKFDCKILARFGILVAGINFDSLIAAYLLNPDKGSYNLTVLAREFLGRSVIEYDEVTAGKATFAEVSIEQATRYGCQDSHFVWLLQKAIQPRLEVEGLTDVLNKIELPLIPILGQMELNGVLLDCELLSRMSEEFTHKLLELEKQIYEIAGSSFNINSPKQVSDILFNKLQISSKGLKRTKTGISSDSSVLEKLSSQHPLPAVMLDYRGLHKLKSTYVDALPQSVSVVTKRLHSSFNQTITATGRLSSSSPNLQNIPISSSDGARIRAAFVAPASKLLISADYSQIELRLLAHISNDKNMTEAFKAGVDIHSQTAREILSLSKNSEITSEQRRMGKTMNFAIIYGMGPFRLSKDLGISFGAAQDYIERYFELYSGVREFFDNTEKQALDLGYVTTLFGRKRILKDIDAAGRDKGFVVRAALNAPIQGSAADIIKLAMINISSEIREKKLDFSLLLQIHDELVFEVDESFAEEARSIIVDRMEKVIELKVPMKVDAGIGKNWQEAHS